MLDDDGQPENKAFNMRRNREKALLSLLGVCGGVVCDRKLNEAEVLFLDTWLRDQEHLRTDPDTVDILDVTGDILLDKQITKDELDDLKTLIIDVLNYREVLTDEDQSLIQLTGVLQGIAADRTINTKELNFLIDWLDNNPNLRTRWPAFVIAKRVEDVIADGIVTEEERGDLLDCIYELVGNKPEATGAVSGLATRLPTNNVKNMEFDERIFCLTGKFLLGPRRKCELILRERGGITVGNVIPDINYLVIGTLASRDWKFTSYGRKIEKALELQQRGIELLIVAEEDLVKYLGK